jgi:glycine cleavage system H protein
MAAPSDRRYADSHEWHKLDGNVVTLGLSRFAVDELTDITFVELPEVDDTFEAGDAIGEVESVKATADVYTGVTGKIVDINEDLVDNPEVINDDPFEAGWLVKIEVGDPAAVDALMDAEAYNEKYPT